MQCVIPLASVSSVIGKEHFKDTSGFTSMHLEEQNIFSQSLKTKKN